MSVSIDDALSISSTEIVDDNALTNNDPVKRKKVEEALVLNEPIVVLDNIASSATLDDLYR